MILKGIKELRLSLGWDQIKMASKTFLSTETIRKAEAGKSVTHSSACRIARALRKRLDEIS